MGAAKIAFISRKLYLNKWGGVARLLKTVNRVIYACDISYKADIKGLLDLPHQGLGVIIGDGCLIGENVIIRQNVTLGGKNYGGVFKYPQIGDNVMIGSGAVVLGDIRVGNNVKIGANAVVLNDVPDNSTAVGIPAKVVNATYGVSQIEG